VDALVPAVVEAFSAASSLGSSRRRCRGRSFGWPSPRVASTIDDNHDDTVAAVNDDEMELQRRYEEAMRRREERRRKVASSSTQPKLQSSQPNSLKDHDVLLTKEDVDWSLNAAVGGATMESMILSIDANLNAYERTVMIENAKSNSNAGKEKRSTTRIKDKNRVKVKEVSNPITENKTVYDDDDDDIFVHLAVVHLINLP
jgi:hypothetical protein